MQALVCGCQRVSGAAKPLVLRSFAQSPFGPWLLILVALGLIAFGILSFVEAKCAAPSAESLSE